MATRHGPPFAVTLGEIPFTSPIVNGTATPAAITRAATTPAPTAIAALPVWAGSDPTTYSQTAAFEIGTNVFVTSSVQVVGVRIWNPGLGARTSRSAKLWEMAGTSFTGGTNVREVALPDQMPTGWSYYLFATPYTAISTKYFVVSYDVGGFGLNDIGHVTQSTQTDSADGKVHYASNPGCYTSAPDTTPTINFISEFWGIDVLYFDSGGTPTPSAVPLSVSAPAPTTQGGSNTTPSAVALVDVVPAPSATGTANTTPAVIALAAVTPAPTATGTAAGTASPATIALAAVTPAPTASGGSNTTPAAVALATVTSAPTATGSTSATPAAVALAATVPAPTLRGNANTSPAAIARTVVTPAPTVTGDAGGTAHPATIVLSVVAPAPTASGSANAAPSAIARTVVVPAPTATGTVGAVLAGSWGPLTGVTVASVSARIEAVLVGSW